MSGDKTVMLTAPAVGIALALATVVLGRAVGFERRTFYVAVTLVTASYYVLFAIMSGEPRAFAGDGAIALVFASIAIVGFKRNLYLVAVALALHALLDANHSALVSNPGTPAWWPPFCLTYDITAAAALAWQIRHSHVARLSRSLS